MLFIYWLAIFAGCFAAIYIAMIPFERFISKRLLRNVGAGSQDHPKDH